MREVLSFGEQNATADHSTEADAICRKTSSCHPRSGSLTEARNLVGRKKELKDVEQAAIEGGLAPSQRHEFSRYLHRCKQSGEHGSKNDRGDFTYQELVEKAREFKEGFH